MPVDPSTIPYRTHAHTPNSARPTPVAAAEAARLARPKRGRGQRHRSPVNRTPPRTYPPDVRLVPDIDGVNYWTDPYGACILAGVTRRTIYDWKQRGWLKIRYMASAKMEIRVDSLWWSPEEREAVRAPVAATTPATPEPPDDEIIDTE